MNVSFCLITTKQDDNYMDWSYIFGITSKQQIT